MITYQSINDSTPVYLYLIFQITKKIGKLFSEGKYSKFDNKIKNKILDFFEKNSGNYVYVHSFFISKQVV
jgi:hypothetical protein